MTLWKANSVLRFQATNSNNNYQHPPTWLLTFRLLLRKWIVLAILPWSGPWSTAAWWREFGVLQADYVKYVIWHSNPTKVSCGKMLWPPWATCRPTCEIMFATILPFFVCLGASFQKQQLVRGKWCKIFGLQMGPRKEVSASQKDPGPSCFCFHEMHPLVEHSDNLSRLMAIKNRSTNGIQWLYAQIMDINIMCRYMLYVPWNGLGWWV